MTHEERIDKLIKLWYLIWINRAPNVQVREADVRNDKSFWIIYEDYEVWSYASGHWGAQFVDSEGNLSILRGTCEFIQQQLEAIPVRERPEFAALESLLNSSWNRFQYANDRSLRDD